MPMFIQPIHIYSTIYTYRPRDAHDFLPILLNTTPGQANVPSAYTILYKGSEFWKVILQRCENIV